MQQRYQVWGEITGTALAAQGRGGPQLVHSRLLWSQDKISFDTLSTPAVVLAREDANVA